MNNRTLQIFAVAVTAWALTLNAVAQPQGTSVPAGAQMIHGTGIRASFFQNQEFFNMLELTPQQITDLQEAWRESTERYQPLVGTFPRPEPNANPQTPEEMRKRQEEMQLRSETWRDESLKRIERVLKPEQRTKFREIIFQLAGGLNSNSSMLNELALSALDLTGTQKEQFRKLVEERNVVLWAIRDSAPPEDRPLPGTVRIGAEVMQAITQFTEQFQSLLTVEQRTKAEKLTAEIPALREKLGLPPPPPPVSVANPQQKPE